MSESAFHQIIFPESEYSPIIIFIIICFFSILTLIICKSALTNVPSILTMTGQLSLMFSLTFILLIVGTISVNAEWLFMFIFTLVVLMTVYASISPSIFFYPPLS